mgnify:CR=1 FL=1
MSRLTVMTDDRASSTTLTLAKEFKQRIIASPPGVCLVEMQLAMLKVCHAQSCGKCVPCRDGLGKLEDLLEDVLNNRATENTLALIEKTAKNIELSADCAIGFEAARMVLVGLDGLQEDYISHVKHHRCSGSFEQPIPCIDQCPAHVDIPGYIALTGAGRYEDAVRLIRKDNPFPVACALICEHPCEQRCRRNMLDSSVYIRGLKRSAVDFADLDSIPVPPKAEPTGKRIAIIGGGPSGLTTAYFLQLMGHQTVVFEEKPALGGMLRYGIPNYRFPRKRLAQDIDYILKTGVEVRLNTQIGRDISMEDLEKEYDAVYISIGAQTDKNFDIEGADSLNVISAVNLLRDVGLEKRLDFSGLKVAVIGGGNVAMDAARTALRLGAENVYIVYRRGMEELPARNEEIEHAEEEGIIFKTLHNPVKLIGDENGRVCKMECVKMELGEPDASGRRRPIAIDGSNFELDVDTVIMSIGTSPNPLLRTTTEGLEANKWGCLVVNEDTLETTRENVYAGGDAVTGAATVILAMGAGKQAAASIHEKLS